MSILEILKASAGRFPFLPEERLVRRAHFVEDDFKKIGLKYQLEFKEFPVTVGAKTFYLPFGSYELMGSECCIENAREGDQKHTSMSGGGLDKESLLYFSKISEWGHDHIPHHWPHRMRPELKDPNQHLNTLREVWWLSHFSGVDYTTVKHDALVSNGKKVDWEFTTFSNLKLRVEVKRRVGDFQRRCYQTPLKTNSMFWDLAEKFPDNATDGFINVGCITLFDPIDREVRIAAIDWLENQNKIDCLCFSAVVQNPHDAFWVLPKANNSVLKQVVLPLDEEDKTYFAPHWFPVRVEQVASVLSNLP